MGAAATNFCAAYATYKKAVEQERKVHTYKHTHAHTHTHTHTHKHTHTHTY